MDASEDWKQLAERLSGKTIDAFDVHKYEKEYLIAVPKGKKERFLGRFMTAAIKQKRMVTHHIFQSGNILAGFSVSKRAYLSK